MLPATKQGIRMSLRVGIVAGESSGDQLGAGLVREILERHPDAQVEGIAGPLMEAAGCRVIEPAEKLSVMGLAEVLGHLPELLRVRARLIRHFLANPPDVFVGVDAPDFNLGVEARLKTAGIPTVHYVSPSVWAWREKRAERIGRSADRVLCLFPFEPEIYARHDVDAVFVGHPLADAIPDHTEPTAARRALGLDPERRWLAVLPGSRKSEVGRLGPVFLRTCRRLQHSHPELGFVAPMATPRLRALFESQLERHAPGLPFELIDGRARDVLGAADAVLLASGTAALEAMLVKRPMVVAYRLNAVTHFLVRALRLLRVPRYSLPNVLAGRELVPEYMQDRARPDLLAGAISELLADAGRRERQVQAFAALHAGLRRNADASAAEAVLSMLVRP